MTSLAFLVMFLMSVNKNDNDGDDNGDCDNDGIMLMTTDILPPGEPVIRRPGPHSALEVDVVPLRKVVYQDGHVVYQDGHKVAHDIEVGGGV